MCISVSPRSIRSWISPCVREGGVFVVVRSSNPEGRELQTARLANGETVAQNLCREITVRNRKQGEGLQYIGAVVGATCDDAAETVDALPQSVHSRAGRRRAKRIHSGCVEADALGARTQRLPNVSERSWRTVLSVADIRTTIRSLQDQARELL